MQSGSVKQPGTTIPILPHSPEAERAVVGAIFLDNDVLYSIVDFLSPEDFYSTANQEIFKTQRMMIQSGFPCDFLTIMDNLSRRGLLDLCGGIGYISSAIDVVPTTREINVQHYAKIVRRKSQLRILIKAGYDLIDRASHDDEDPDIISAESSAQLSLVEDDATTLLETQQLVEESSNRYQQLEKNPEAAAGILTGLTRLDSLTGGFRPGEMALIAARPSMGKTALMTSMMVKMLTQTDRHPKIGVFSIEQKRSAIMDRMVQNIARIDGQNLRMASMEAHEWKQAHSALFELLDREFWIDDSGNTSLQRIVAVAKRMRIAKKLDVLFIDYLSKIRHRLPNNQTHARHDVVAAISNELSTLSKDLNIPVVVLHQLNRLSGVGQRPELENLAESGFTERDADTVMFIWKRLKKVKKDQTPEEQSAKKKIEFREEWHDMLTIAKQRNGPVGDCRITFLKRYTAFENYEPIGGTHAENPGDEHGGAGAQEGLFEGLH